MKRIFLSSNLCMPLLQLLLKHLLLFCKLIKIAGDGNLILIQVVGVYTSADVIAGDRGVTITVKRMMTVV